MNFFIFLSPIIIFIQSIRADITSWNGILPGNHINLTIYNNLNYSIVITNMSFSGNCYHNCDHILLEPCEIANIYISTWMYFKDVFLTFQVFRYYYGKPNNQENIILKDSLYSVFDVLPTNKKCMEEPLKVKKSLIIQTNDKADDNMYCLDRFIDISDEIEKIQCIFDDMDSHP